MRQASPTTNLVLAIVLSIGAVLALGTPWYALAEAPSGSSDGAMEAIASDIYEFFTSPGTSGADALGTGKQPLIVLAGVAAALALLMMVPALRRFVRTPLRFVPMAAPIFILVKAGSHPGPGLELRWGILAAFALAALAASSAFHGSAILDPKPKPKPYVPPASPGSFAPPGA